MRLLFITLLFSACSNMQPNENQTKVNPVVLNYMITYYVETSSISSIQYYYKSSNFLPDQTTPWQIIVHCKSGDYCSLITQDSAGVYSLVRILTNGTLWKERSASNTTLSQIVNGFLP